MFNDKFGLTQAVLDGRKTMTRRIVSNNILAKVKLFQEEYFNASFDFLEGKDLIEAYLVNYPEKLPYRVGEVVAIAQCLRDVYAEFDFIYRGRVTKDLMDKFGGIPAFKNKMFVKASEMPHRIMISRVCLERLQDISDEDCIKEGIYYKELATSKPYGVFDSFGSFLELGSTPRQAFSVLIDKVSGRGVWDSNPFVFSYEFTLVQ